MESRTSRSYALQSSMFLQLAPRAQLRAPMCSGAVALQQGRDAGAIARADRATYRPWCSRRERVRARAFSLRSSIAHCVRSPIEAPHRRRVKIFFARRAQALERNSTTQYIGLELPDERSVAEEAAGVRP